MKPLEPRLAPSYISELFLYDPSTGLVTRKTSRGPCRAGSIVAGDYVKIDGYSYVLARVVWCLHYNEWPPTDMLVDHENRIHGDNKIGNLRLATYSQNSFNQGARAIYAKGVYRRDRNIRPWAARIMVNGKSKELGSYLTHDGAAEAYRQAALKHHGEFACLK